MTNTFTILDPPGSTSTLNKLNDAGDVVDSFQRRPQHYGTPRTPVPEPTTWLMILAGFAGLACLSLRSSRRPQVARAAL